MGIQGCLRIVLTVVTANSALILGVVYFMLTTFRR